MQGVRVLRRYFFASSALQVRTSRAKQPLSLKKKDVAPSLNADNAQNRGVPAVQAPQAQPPQPYYQPAPAPTLGQSIIDGFSFGIGSAIARRMVDSVWPGGGGIVSGGGDGSAADVAPQQPSSGPQAPTSPGGQGWGDTQYSEDPFDDSGDGDGEDDF